MPYSKAWDREIAQLCELAGADAVAVAWPDGPTVVARSRQGRPPEVVALSPGPSANVLAAVDRAVASVRGGTLVPEAGPGPSAPAA